MTRKQTNGILTALLLALVGVAGARAWLDRSRPGAGGVTDPSAPLLRGFDPVKVARLSIRGPADEEVELARDGESWRVESEGGYRADSAAVEEALLALAGLTQGKVVSRQGKNLEGYQLVGEKAISVAAEDRSGGSLVKLVVGKLSGNFRSTYVKLAAESAVRRVPLAIRTSFDKTGPRATWRDRTIFAGGDAAALQRIEIEGAGRRIAFEKVKTADADPDSPAAQREEFHWSMTAPFRGRVKKFEIERMAKTLSELDCQSFHFGEEDATALGLDPPAWRVTATGEGGAKVVLRVGRFVEREGRYPVQVPGQDVIWWVSEVDVVDFTREPERYLEEPPDPGDQDGGGGENPVPESGPDTDGKREDTSPGGGGELAPSSADGGV